MTSLTEPLIKEITILRHDAGPPLEIQIEGCKASNLSKSVGNLREILKIEGCNSGLPQKSRGAIATLAPFLRQPCDGASMPDSSLTCLVVVSFLTTL